MNDEARAIIAGREAFNRQHPVHAIYRIVTGGSLTQRDGVPLGEDFLGGYRTDCYGRGQALHGDKTTTGATCYGSLPNSTEYGRMILRVGDLTSACPKCGQTGRIITGEPRATWHCVPSAVDGSIVLCGCPSGCTEAD